MFLRDNLWTGNKYMAVDPSSELFRDVKALRFMTWAEWRAWGHDPDGALKQGNACQQ